MKKLATLILAAGLVFGAATGAKAIDFKAKGWWVMSFEEGQNGKFQGKDKGHTTPGWGKDGQDEFLAKQRVRLQLDAVASEALSGTVFFEMDSTWGKNDSGKSGGALGADGSQVIKLKSAYLDWMVPETDAKVRMGIQGLSLPAYASGSPVLYDDVAGIVVSGKIDETVGVTAFWVRPYNDNYAPTTGNTSRAGYLDNFDMFGLLVPLTLDGAKVTPWGMYGMIGPNTFSNGTTWNGNMSNLGASNKAVNANLFPLGGARTKNFGTPYPATKLSSYGQAWWGGLSSEISVWDPFRVAFDFEYGSVTWEDEGRLNRQGWMAALLAEFKMDWVTPGLYGWYSSGDDDNPSNGSERLPGGIDNNSGNNFSNFAFNGNPWIAREGVINSSGMAGTWGIGGRLKNMSFVEDLKHTFRINYIGGTNSTSMAKKMSMANMWANSSVMGNNGMYLTTADSAVEFGLVNEYQMYENFNIFVDANYIHMMLDTSSSVWGARHKEGKSIPQTRDAWNVNASFVYSF